LNAWSSVCLSVLVRLSVCLSICLSVSLCLPAWRRELVVAARSRRQTVKAIMPLLGPLGISGKIAEQLPSSIIHTVCKRAAPLLLA
jgi:hypothetical protein